jgi:hypothetical protein
VNEDKAMHHLTWPIDGVALGAVVASITGALTQYATLLATLLAVVWYLTQLWVFFSDRRRQRRKEDYDANRAEHRDRGPGLDQNS